MARRAQPVPLPWIRVDREAGISAERQISGALRQAIRQGLLPRGFRLPSVRQLALDLDVSRRVTSGAYTRLEAEGYVASHRGGATMVIADAAPLSRQSSSVAPSSRARSMPPPPPRERAAFPWRHWKPSTNRYDLREIIAAQLCPIRGITATADEIVLTNGPDAALACAARLLADPGDFVLIEETCDPRTRALFEHYGLRCTLEASDHPRFFHVHTPMSRGDQYLLLQSAKSIDAAILEEDDDSEHPLKTIDSDGRVIFIGSFEKTLMPDIGIAYMVLPADLACLASRLAPRPPVMIESALADFITRGEFARHLVTAR